MPVEVAAALAIPDDLLEFRAVRASGRNLDELTLEEMDRLWDDAKSAERN